MRRALGFLLLVGCHSRQDPLTIQRVLSEKTIDVERLEKIFRIEPDSLKIHRPAVPSVALWTFRGPWTLENRGRRGVWLRRDQLKVGVEFKPFLPPEERFAGRFGGRVSRPPRPAFVAEEWAFVEPGGTISLGLPPLAQEPGTYTFTMAVMRSGEQFCWQARDFNGGAYLDRPKGLSDPILLDRVEQLVLPSIETAGAPWHGSEAIDPVPLEANTFELSWDLQGDVLPAGPSELDGFVLDDGGAVVYEGRLRTDDFVSEWLAPPIRGQGGVLRFRMTCSLPITPNPGTYRILVRAQDAEAFFLHGVREGRVGHFCDAPRGAYSRWVEFRVE